MSNNQESQFTFLAESIIDRIATLLEDQDPEGILDLDFSSDMLNILTPQGQYVINKHSAAKEIWLASPKTGPYHFAYNEGQKLWLDSKNIELITLLENELNEFLPVDLSILK